MNEALATILVLVVPVVAAIGLIELAVRLARRRKHRQGGLTVTAIPTLAEELHDLGFSQLAVSLPLHMAEMATAYAAGRTQFSGLSPLLTDAAWELGMVVPTPADLQEILQNPTLKFREHTKKDIRKWVGQLDMGTRLRNLQKSQEAIAGIRDSARGWNQLANNLRTLWDKASKGIVPSSKTKPAARWGWLRHGIEFDFLPPGSDKTYTWMPWCILARPDLLSRLVECIAREILDSDWRFEAVCAMSSTGAPIATQLASMFTQKGSPKYLMAVDDQEFDILPEYGAGLGRKPQSIVLVDSGIQTGGHLASARKKADSEGIKVAGVVSFCWNDYLTPEKKQRVDPLVRAMLNRRELIYLLKISQLYERHVKNGN